MDQFFETKLTMLKHEKEIWKEYQKAERKRHRRYRNWITISVRSAALLLSILGVVGVPWIIITRQLVWYWQIIDVSVMFAGYFLLKLADNLEFGLMAKSAPFHALKPDSPPWLFFELERHPLHIAFLAHELGMYISTISPEQRKQLSNIFLKRSETAKRKVWFTLSMIGVFSFASYGAFVQAALGLDTDVKKMMEDSIIYTILSMTFVIVVVFNRFSLEKSVLKKSVDYQILSELLSDC
ncbi:hypothetical protein F4V43_13565 [Paenibacillus spiritus]|uniref:Uncharacterized protein n=1 Tax=Paenibacillus spiritus TaxID=2496557 RepID=A0A5J5G5C2_9BACL|nr:hypothetical protein [Paenibacillus spiritus]KAA9002083.1 hypothetical protein F4V43_13565 [Paenibacillus spiritus]